MMTCNLNNISSNLSELREIAENSTSFLLKNKSRIDFFIMIPVKCTQLQIKSGLLTNIKILFGNIISVFRYLQKETKNNVNYFGKKTKYLISKNMNGKRETNQKLEHSTSIQ